MLGVPRGDSGGQLENLPVHPREHVRKFALEGQLPQKAEYWLTNDLRLLGLDFGQPLRLPDFQRSPLFQGGVCVHGQRSKFGAPADRVSGPAELRSVSGINTGYPSN